VEILLATSNDIIFKGFNHQRIKEEMAEYLLTN